MSRTPVTLRSAAPVLGQTTDEVFREYALPKRRRNRQLKKENVDI